MKFNYNKHYIPILKAKMGELRALSHLEDDDTKNLIPLLEIPLSPWDYTNDQPSKEIGPHMSGVLSNIAKYWNNKDFLISLSREILTAEDEGNTTDDYIEALSETLEQEEYKELPLNFVIPIIVPSFDYEKHYEKIVSILDHNENSNFTIRILIDLLDFDNDLGSLEEEIKNILDKFEREIENSTILIDLGSVWRDDASAVMLSIKLILANIPDIQHWENIVVSMSSFPDSLSCVEKRTTSDNFKRVEWHVWNKIIYRDIAKAIYSDYSIAHPLLNEVDPRIINMYASIRYTLNDRWFILRGDSLRDFGFSQYPQLCKDLIESGKYFGKRYSWGDSRIKEYTEDGNEKTGNATTWREIGNNHHFKLVLQQLSSLDADA
jgi:hypothetical protein